MIPAEIPLDIDVEAILRDLREWGWLDQKIEVVCGFSAGYCAKLRKGSRPLRPYQHAARLHNFWVSESVAAAGRQTLATTTG